MRGKIDTQSGEESGAPFVIDGAGSMVSALVVGECDRVIGQELAEVARKAGGLGLLYVLTMSTRGLTLEVP